MADQTHSTYMEQALEWFLKRCRRSFPAHNPKILSGLIIRGTRIDPDLDDVLLMRGQERWSVLGHPKSARDHARGGDPLE